MKMSGGCTARSSRRHGEAGRGRALCARLRWRLSPFRFLAIACIVVVLCSGCATVSPAAKSLVGKPVTEGRLMLLSGDDVSLVPDDGRTKVLLFWATWCPYSKGAIEDYESLAREYAGRDDLLFYAVSIDRNEDISVLESRISEQDLKTMQHVFSGNDIQDEAFLSLHGNTIPYAVVIDGRGTVKFVDIGVSGLSSFLSESYSTR